MLVGSVYNLALNFSREQLFSLDRLVILSSHTQTGILSEDEDDGS